VRVETGGSEDGGRREDGFIYLSRRSSLYFTAPPRQILRRMVSRADLTKHHPQPLRPSSLPLATAFHRCRHPARLAIECKCKTLKRRANLLNVLSDVKSRALVLNTTTKSGGHHGRVSRLMATRNINPLRLKIPPRVY